MSAPAGYLLLIEKHIAELGGVGAQSGIASYNDWISCSEKNKRKILPQNTRSPELMNIDTSLESFFAAQSHFVDLFNKKNVNNIYNYPEQNQVEKLRRAFNNIEGCLIDINNAVAVWENKKMNNSFRIAAMNQLKDMLQRSEEIIGSIKFILKQQEAELTEIKSEKPKKIHWSNRVNQQTFHSQAPPNQIKKINLDIDEKSGSHLFGKQKKALKSILKKPKERKKLSALDSPVSSPAFSRKKGG